VVRGVGKTLIAIGTLLLLFVAYQLWGTGLQEARSQRALRTEFRRSLPAAVEPSKPTPTTVPLPPVPGDAVALIEIPRIGVDKAVVEGVGVADLRKGPGHYPGTVMPGQPGHAAIAGHRTTYGAPFYDLDQVEAGDEIVVTTRQGRFRYVVDRISVVPPSDVSVLAATDETRLTLTTCNPRYSARQRLVVSAVLRGEPAPAPPVAEPTTGAPRPVLLEEPKTLHGDTSARMPATAWGLAAAAAALATSLVARRWRRWPAYALGLLPFLTLLYLCYENIARLLPPNF
jgi:sortase A